MASHDVSVDVDAVCSLLWKRALSKVKDAVVFCDDSLFESLHWQLGDDAFFLHGAKQVRDFSPFESGPKGVEKAVFLTSQPLLGDAVQTIREILTNSEDEFFHVIVVTTVPARLHYYLKFGVFEDETGGGSSMEVFQQFESKVSEWMQRKGSDGPHCAEVLHIPALDASKVIPAQNFCLLTSKSAKSINSLLDTDLAVINKEVDSTSSLDFSHLTPSFRTSVKTLVSLLDSMFEQLSLVEEVFSVGDLSRCVGREMANLPMAKTRRRNLGAANDRGVKAAVIFVDRTLDLATVTSQSDDAFSCISRLLPPLPSHSVDVKIDLTPLIPPRKKQMEKLDESKAETEEKMDADSKDGDVVSDVELKANTEKTTTTTTETKPEIQPSEELKRDSEEDDDDSFHSIFGCLSHPREDESARLLPSILRLKSKDALNLLLMTLRKRVEDIRRKRGEKPAGLDDEVSGKISVIVENLSRLLATCREDGIFLDALKANLDSGFSGKMDPVGQLGIWEMSLAAVQAFQGRQEEVEKADSILAMEKALLQTMPDEVEAESATFIANQLLKIFRKELQNVKKEKRDKKRKREKKSKDDSPAKESRINFRDAVLLLVHVYSLCGPETGSQLSRSDGVDKLKAIFSKYVEELLQLFVLDESINESSNISAEDASAVLEKRLESEHEPLALRMEIREAVRERKGVDAFVENLFSRLSAVSSARRNLKTLDRLYDPGSLTKAAESTPLLRQLVRHVSMPTDTKSASSEKSDRAPDIEHHSSGVLKDLLKTSFSYFMGSVAVKPKPSDATVVVIFVIGGMTPSEIKLVQDEMKSVSSKLNSSEPPQVLLWSNKLLKPNDILRSTLQPEMEFL